MIQGGQARNSIERAGITSALPHLVILSTSASEESGLADG